jgi:hypothetical protein
MNEFYTKFTVVVNYAQNTIFLSKLVDLEKFLACDEVEVFVGTVVELKRVLERLEGYDLEVVTPSELEELLKEWGCWKSGENGIDWDEEEHTAIEDDVR